MVRASFEHEGNMGTLTVTTHFGETVKIPCEKRNDEQFRLGGTGITQVVCYEGLILRLSKDSPFVRFRAFRTPENYFEATGLLSPEDWDSADLHCYITEHYSLDMEGKPPGWLISKQPIKEAHRLFINLDVLDGGGNLIKRYRVSPFCGDHKVIE